MPVPAPIYFTRWGAAGILPQLQCPTPWDRVLWEVLPEKGVRLPSSDLNLESRRRDRLSLPVTAQEVSDSRAVVVGGRGPVVHDGLERHEASLGVTGIHEDRIVSDG